MDECNIIYESSAHLDDTINFSTSPRPQRHRHFSGHLSTGVEMGPSIINLATRLRLFYATHSISAETFLASAFVVGLPTFPRLEYLVLTSALLQRHLHCRAPEFVNLVVMAGRIAFQSMPKLKSLILWDGENTGEILLRFTVSAEKRPIVFWRSTQQAPGDLSLASRGLRHELKGSLQHHSNVHGLQIVHESTLIHRADDGFSSRLKQDAAEFPEMNRILHLESMNQRSSEEVVALEAAIKFDADIYIGPDFIAILQIQLDAALGKEKINVEGMMR
ncbi:F-box domain-containing protein [Verticillium dahliae]